LAIVMEKGWLVGCESVGFLTHRGEVPENGVLGGGVGCGKGHFGPAAGETEVTTRAAITHDDHVPRAAVIVGCGEVKLHAWVAPQRSEHLGFVD
jgi:hypothetical protein